jgi:hypothetical protein
MKKSVGIALLLLLACNKNSNQHSMVVPDVVQAEKRRGNIIGSIRLVDMDGKSLEDGSGVKVTIDQTNVSATSNGNGKWSLDSIPFGTYDLTLSKPGFGSTRIMGVYHSALNHTTTNISAPRYLSMISTVEISKVTVRKFTESFSKPQDINSVANMIFLGLLEEGIIFNPVFVNNTAGEKAIRFFMSASPDVSSTNYTVSEKQYYTGKENVVENDNFKISWFISKGFQPGQTVYLKAYGDGRFADDYEDPISGLSVFPCLSAKGSPVVSFVVPGNK